MRWRAGSDRADRSIRFSGLRDLARSRRSGGRGQRGDLSDPPGQLPARPADRRAGARLRPPWRVQRAAGRRASRAAASRVVRRCRPRMPGLRSADDRAHRPPGKAIRFAVLGLLALPGVSRRQRVSLIGRIGPIRPIGPTKTARRAASATEKRPGAGFDAPAGKGRGDAYASCCVRSHGARAEVAMEDPGSGDWDRLLRRPGRFSSAAVGADTSLPFQARAGRPNG